MKKVKVRENNENEKVRIEKRRDKSKWDEIESKNKRKNWKQRQEHSRYSEGTTIEKNKGNNSWRKRKAEEEKGELDKFHIRKVQKDKREK